MVFRGCRVDSSCSYKLLLCTEFAGYADDFEEFVDDEGGLTNLAPPSVSLEAERGDVGDMDTTTEPIDDKQVDLSTTESACAFMVTTGSKFECSVPSDCQADFDQLPGPDEIRGTSHDNLTMGASLASADTTTADTFEIIHGRFGDLHQSRDAYVTIGGHDSPNVKPRVPQIVHNSQESVQASSAYAANTADFVGGAISVLRGEVEGIWTPAGSSRSLVADVLAGVRLLESEVGGEWACMGDAVISCPIVRFCPAFDFYSTSICTLVSTP